uniref:(northern house mosquito) hypothetical protein n=2 Tax=Culex pipiens TaxID=7175 RepID=A0A8D8BA39_CULPI
MLRLLLWLSASGDGTSGVVAKANDIVVVVVVVTAGAGRSAGLVGGRGWSDAGPRHPVAGHHRRTVSGGHWQIFGRWRRGLQLGWSSGSRVVQMGRSVGVRANGRHRAHLGGRRLRCRSRRRHRSLGNAVAAQHQLRYVVGPLGQNHAVLLGPFALHLEHGKLLLGEPVDPGVGRFRLALHVRPQQLHERVATFGHAQQSALFGEVTVAQFGTVQHDAERRRVAAVGHAGVQLVLVRHQ